MRENDSPVTPPSAAEATGSGASTIMPLGEAVVLATVAVAAGGVILAVAVTWGAAEAAVSVGAAYLVYSAITSRGDLSGSVAVRLLTGVFRSAAVEPAAG